MMRAVPGGDLAAAPRAGSFRSAPGMASSRRTTASTEYAEGGGADGRAESFTSARSFGQASMHSTGSGALSNQARPAGPPYRVWVGPVQLAPRRAGPPVVGYYDVITKPQVLCHRQVKESMLACSSSICPAHARWSSTCQPDRRLLVGAPLFVVERVVSCMDVMCVAERQHEHRG
jgi:hypothetical protein